MRKRLVIKIGGSVIVGERPAWLEDLQILAAEGFDMVIIHGAGPFISKRLTQLGLPVAFIKGQRVTTHDIMNEVAGIMRGQVNAELVNVLQYRGLNAVGLSGVDGRLLQARILSRELGRVGTVNKVTPSLIETLWCDNWVPVIAPIASDGQGGLLNCNGDGVAGAVAGALQADSLIFYTDSGGVRRRVDDPESVVPRLTRNDAVEWLSREIATGGMIPKLEAAISALDEGVGMVRIGSLDPERSDGTTITK